MALKCQRKEDNLWREIMQMSSKRSPRFHISRNKHVSTQRQKMGNLKYKRQSHVLKSRIKDKSQKVQVQIKSGYKERNKIQKNLRKERKDLTRGELKMCKIKIIR